jgi:hypothetical protein
VLCVGERAGLPVRERLSGFPDVLEGADRAGGDAVVVLPAEVEHRRVASRVAPQVGVQ